MQHPLGLIPSTSTQASEPRWRERTALAWEQAGVHPEWVRVLLSPDSGLDAAWARLGDRLAERLEAGDRVLPAPELVLRALGPAPEAVKVLIVGQDPYPTPGHAIGLSFATDPSVRPLPRSLANLRSELQDDLGLPLPPHGDLSAWVSQGVMLLNRTLTVSAGEAGSHARLGWDTITDAVVRRLGAQQGPPVAILWGRHAQAVRPLLGTHPIIESAHPSPLSARRGFFGSRPFSRANEALATLGVGPVDWSLGDAAASDARPTTLF